MDESEIRNIVAEELNKFEGKIKGAREVLEKRIDANKEVVDAENRCLKEDMEKAHESIREELCHKYEDVKKGLANEIDNRKESLGDEINNRKEAIKHMNETVEHKADLTRWMISGAFVAMASMAGVMYNLITTGDASVIVELCQQGTALANLAVADSNVVIGYLNELGVNDNRFPTIREHEIANCRIS